MLRQLAERGDCDAVRTAFCFPDVYEIGMSNLALQILYKVLNSEDYTSCERASSPWHDMDALATLIPQFGNICVGIMLLLQEYTLILSQAKPT